MLSCRVLATSRRPYHYEAQAIGVEYYTDVDDFCEEHPEVVILASSILSTEAVLKSLPMQRLKRSTLFVDVLSVKVSVLQHHQQLQLQQQQRKRHQHRQRQRQQQQTATREVSGRVMPGHVV